MAVQGFGGTPDNRQSAASLSTAGSSGQQQPQVRTSGHNSTRPAGECTSFAFMCKNIMRCSPNTRRVCSARGRGKSYRASTQLHQRAALRQFNQRAATCAGSVSAAGVGSWPPQRRPRSARAHDSKSFAQTLVDSLSLRSGAMTSGPTPVLYGWFSAHS